MIWGNPIFYLLKGDSTLKGGYTFNSKLKPHGVLTLRLEERIRLLDQEGAQALLAKGMQLTEEQE